jgi:hypothetical protein
VFLKTLNALCICLQYKHPRSIKRVIRSDKPVTLLLLLWSHKCDFGAEPSRIIATSAVKGLKMLSTFMFVCVCVCFVYFFVCLLVCVCLLVYYFVVVFVVVVVVVVFLFYFILFQYIFHFILRFFCQKQQEPSKGMLQFGAPVPVPMEQTSQLEHLTDPILKLENNNPNTHKIKKKNKHTHTHTHTHTQTTKNENFRAESFFDRRKKLSFFRS